MSSFSFILTEKCNWNCEYCSIVGLKEPKLETFQKHLPYIKEVIDKIQIGSIDIQGGEVGLIPIDILEYFFQTLQKKVIVSTNGVFLNKKIHLNKKIRPYIDMIMWHVTEDFKKVEVDYNDDKIHISKGIVHNNIDEIIEFLKLNQHIIFDYIEFDFDIQTKRKRNFLMYHDILNRLKNMENVTRNAKYILESRLYEKEEDRDRCTRYNTSIVLDLVNENICLCQRQPNISIPLNKENLLYRIKTFPKDVFSENNCNTCTRLYSGKEIDVVNFFKNRRTL